MEIFGCLRIKVVLKRFFLTLSYLLLGLNSFQVFGSSIAPCTVENYIAPSSQYEINQLRNNLDADVKLAFQSGNRKLFYGLLCRAAAANLVEAELRLGAIHIRGWGFVKQNYYYARYWLERAAAKGHIKAIYMLGTLYLDGKGGPVKGQQGISLMTRAAEAGNAVAMLEMAQQYILGKHVLQSINTAKYWAQRAKQAGHPTGQKMLDILENAPPSMRR